MQQARAAGDASVVKVLLDELHAWQKELPDELLEPLTLSDVRFHLQRLTSSYLEVQPLLAAIDSTSDDQIEVILDVSIDWLDVGNGWCARELPTSRTGAAGAENLRALRELAKAPVTAERTLSYLVQLLRDPAYAHVPMHLKLYQLTKSLITELVRTEREVREDGSSGPSADWAGSTVPDAADWIPYAEYAEARRHGAVDTGGWSFNLSGFKAGGMVIGDASYGIELQRTAICCGDGASAAFMLC